MPETLRADARSNRDQILAAALILFREQGIDVAMKEIADRAGVGVGTLYRRFPDRDTLIAAAAHAHLADLAERAATIRREAPDNWSALCRFLRDCAEMRLGALASAIEPALHQRIKADPTLVDARSAVVDHVTAMTVAAQADGALRADIDPQDIFRLMTVQIYGEGLDRVVDIMLDGLRAVGP
ncbi:TetR/AcrR family transcriptional regulator [Nocardia stercoris]|uniref:TetR/AcrR family transcriptional regulator n=1 Tax=Nocardia stercoris TaxID=2483361 RepID=A0A3M2L7B1_9NOCA|nr:TetR/AcrR family transcriptional regulator [Nocardia stercoris]RMI31795.1 TetR/AcrR family transcriptional regulator [Nocardia stercoris]